MTRSAFALALGQVRDKLLLAIMALERGDDGDARDELDGAVGTLRDVSEELRA